MTRIRPFRGLRYDPARVDLARVIAPPYDVIPPGERELWFARDPYNAIRLELCRDVAEEARTDYGEIRQILEAWQRSGVLRREPRPACYGLRQHFSAPDGSARTREAFYALLHLEDYERRIVRPHEQTLAGPKADRLKLIRASRANLSSVFLLFEDREQVVARILAPAFEVGALEVADPGGVRQLLAPIDSAERIRLLQEELAERPLVIADGHHRYETALAYRDECRAAAGGAVDADAPHEWILACLTNAFAPGSLLLPIHRLVLKGALPTPAAFEERLRGWRRREVAVASAEAVPALLAQHLVPLRDRHAFALDDASGSLHLFSRPADGQLSVRVVHREVIEGVFGLDERAVREGAIEYPKDALQTARELRAGRGLAGLYLNALAPEDVFRVTAAGERLPQKSTFFYPKLPTGLVLRSFEEGA